MTELSGYVLKTLRSDSEFTLCRAHRFDGRDPILVLSPTSEQQSPEHLRRLEHELSLAEELDSAWSVRPRMMVRHNGYAMLVMEDPGGYPLEPLPGRPLELMRFLRVAISLTEAIGQLHRRGLIHKDIKPANLLTNEAGDVRLTGFGMASRLPRERQAPAPAEAIAGTFAYMAPEQTGRMNRSIDTRSDLYSVGIVLYELLTGTLPFSASDPMEWIHCHIARKPQPPGERVGGVPHAVETIILKLLAKNSEDRYQTAAGVTADLRECAAALEMGRRVEPFPLGAHDILDRLLIPEKLYGREAEIEALVAAFGAVAVLGETGHVFVSGRAGIGKSSVVNELHKVLVPQRGLFAAGKFDQYNRDIPYATLAQAFQGLIRQLLSKNDAELGRWREALLEALGPSGQLMINLIPELALIIGEQSPVADLAPQDAQNRFLLVFQRLLGVFAGPAHPLVIFLDDMQWVDVATVELLERLIGAPDVGYLLVICAYRDEEVGPAHPLKRILATVATARGAIKQLQLGPLTPTNVGQLVADALHAKPDRVATLAELMFEKTGGNPFFTIQFLTALAGEGLIAFDPATAHWQWDLDRIRAKGITDNVADLMAGRLNRLLDATLRALKQFACLGNRAKITTLTRVLGCSEAETRASLWEALRAGLIFDSDDDYAFAHDRVHEASYALVPEQQRASRHLEIGRVLASTMPPAELEENIFEIVNQFNRGTALIASVAERQEVASLNLIAGKRAQASMAFESALGYFAAGRALLSADSWQRQYRLTFDLELHQAECEFLTAAYTACEARLATLKQHATDLIDLAKVVPAGVLLYLASGRSDQAVAISLEYLERVGIIWPAHPSDKEVRQEYERTWSKLAGRKIESLIDLPLMSDPECLATMDVLSQLLLASDFVDKKLQDLVLFRITNLSLENGNTDVSTFAYSVFNMVLGPIFGDYQMAYRFGQLALDLVDQRGLDRFKARVHQCVTVFVHQWTRPLRACQGPLRRTLDMSNAIGDRTFAAYTYRHMVMNLLASGAPLGEVQQEADKCLKYVRSAGFADASERFVGHLELIRYLRGLALEPRGTANAEPNGEGPASRLETRPNLAMAACFDWIDRLQESYFAQDYAAGIAAAEEAARLAWATRSLFEESEYHFYGALTRAAVYESASAEGKPHHLQKLHEHDAKVAFWSLNCPETFASRAALVSAEIARLECRDLDAIRLYEESIRLAREHGLVHNEGVANECAARFHAARGFSTMSDAHLRNARSCYLRWGADGKVRQMERAYSQLRQEAPHQSMVITGTAAEQMDLATVVKVMQAVSSEIDLRKLIETLMVTALEHAGGDRSLLILSGDEMWVNAEARVVDDAIQVDLRHARVGPSDLPESVMHYVVRTQESMLLDDATTVSQFSGDEYVRNNQSRSILCLPLTKQTKLVGVLYVENSQVSYAFTPARIAVLRLLASEAAISLENARLYSELQHTEANLAQAQRLTRTGHFEMDVSSGRISWSEEVYRIFEIELGTEVTLERLFQRAPPEDRNGMRQFIEHMVQDGGERSFQHRLVMLDGSIKTLNIIARAVRDEAGKLRLIGTAMDITESARTREQLQASLAETQLARARLQEAQRLVQLGTWVWDLSTNKIICSEEHRQIFGFTPEQLNSTYEFSLNTLHPDDQQRVKNIVEKAIREGATFSCEFRTVLPDGSIRNVHGQGGPSAVGAGGAREYIGTILDITERKQREEERQKLVSLIENSSDYIGYSSTIGPIEYVNAGGRRLVGLEPDENLSTYLMSDLRGPGDDQRFEDEVFPALLRHGHWEGERLWRHLKTDAPIPVLQTIFYVNDAATGHRIGVATISRDISERKDAEDALRKSQQELTRIARLTTMGELAGSIAHEVNQPLMAIVTNGAACLGWLSADNINLEKARVAAERIVSDGHRAGDIVRNIRELTRKTAPRMTRLDINSVIEATLDLMRAELRQNGILLDASLCADLHPVNGDRVQLQQVILNLVKNAMEAMEAMEGSADQQHVLRVSTDMDSHNVLQASVSDTGVGLDFANAERIFDAFYTTKPEGIGLGLSICRSIVETHGGRLWALPNTPSGSVFHFTLPIVASELPNGTA